MTIINPLYVNINFVRANYIYKTKKIVRRVALLYIFTNLSHVWINRKWVLKSPSSLSVLLDTVLVELYEENLALHKNVIGKDSILIDL